MASMTKDLEALASKANRQEIKGQSLLAAEGQLRVRAEERQQAEARAVKAGKPPEAPCPWGPEDAKEWAIRSAYDRQMENRGNRSFRKEDMMMPE